MGRTQTRDEGRFLGGRPPYGYRLVDAGPHPNPMHAMWGRRLQRLDPDPVTSPIVRWIFAERLAGRSVAGIAAALNERALPCLSQADSARNRHRAKVGWATTTVRSILGNARYTGRQVWNRQPARYSPPHLPGPFRTQCWVRPDQWVVSVKVAHPALVSEADFVAVQQLAAGSSAGRGVAHCYQLAGWLRCGRCGRAFESCWSHGRPAYRCRHGQTSAQPRRGRTSNLYVREDRIVAILQGLIPDCREDRSGRRLAEHLSRHELVLLCTETVCTLERA
ncbi:recombinase family protein [Dactylosporangium sp. NPDC048998]|uniref:recombinase family protein n=1 Tax=Dactylosporangium sp. NPDC048998 TaxID=3363976 RepID=UPI00371958DB